MKDLSDAINKDTMPWWQKASKRVGECAFMVELTDLEYVT